MATNETHTPRRICATCDWWHEAEALFRVEAALAVLEWAVECAENPEQLKAYESRREDLKRDDVMAKDASCRRYPPRGKHGFPLTEGRDWCGEWAPRRKDRGGDHE